ncbi:MAG TPA: hypothetical protein VG457_11680, partial [Planctomycetota bacterium]|nr:hypothetical protein [Planctomycetota bacterium]
MTDDLEERRGRIRESEEAAPPTIARVRVLEVLKGGWERSQVRVGSGPIRSCAPWSVHYPFHLGETKIFILPDYPKDGLARLAYGGSLLDGEKASFVQTRLLWAHSYRDAYLEEIRQRTPDVHRTALDLAQEMRSSSVKWP